jgi:hypothetical protein
MRVDISFLINIIVLLLYNHISSLPFHYYINNIIYILLWRKSNVDIRIADCFNVVYKLSYEMHEYNDRVGEYEM